MRRNTGSVIGVMILAGALIHLLMLAAGVALVVGAVWVVYRAVDALWSAYLRRRARKARQLAELRDRADYEHHLYLAGDPRGVYGQYPPAV